MSAVATAPDGSPIYQLTLAEGELTATILTFGAALRDLRLTDYPHPLVLGYADPWDYVTNPNYFGATVGRFANRIRDGRARIGDRVVQLDQNTAEGHLLHGGRRGTAHMNWAVIDQTASAVTLGITLADGHMGFPGQLDARVTYSVLPDATLGLEITATTTATTLCSFAHHSYFNLDGRPSLTEHELRVHADHYLPVDMAGIPQGTIASVSGTRFDLRKFIGMSDVAVLDHNFCLPSSDKIALYEAATLRAGLLEMQLRTNAPGLQVYTGEGITRNGPVGLLNAHYGPRAGLALEPQIWPDSPNHIGFPSAELKPGEVYRQRSEFRFCAN